jgi:hypothetical protein
LPAQSLIVIVAATTVAVFVAHQLASLKKRAATGWMRATALFPRSLVLLALLPNRAARPGAAA